MYTHDLFPERAGINVNVHGSNFVQGSGAKLEKNCDL